MVHFVVRFDVNAGPPQVIVDDHPQYWSRIRHADECLARDVVWIDRLMRSEAEIAWLYDHAQVPGEEVEHQIGFPPFSLEENHVELAPHPSTREVRGILARGGALSTGEF